MDTPPAVLGRDVELLQVWAEIAARRSVVVVGPGGIGKTSLVADAVEQSGLPASWGAGVDFLQSRSHSALITVLGRPPRPGDGAAVADEVVRSLGPDGIVVLDDLQWADDDTISALGWLAQHGCLVGCVRPGGARAERVLDALRPVSTIVELGPLAPRDAEALARSCSRSGSDDQSRSIAAYAGGVPLAIVALARAGLEPGPASREPLQAVVASWSTPMKRCLAGAYLAADDRWSEAEGAADLLEAGWARRDAAGRLEAVSDALAEQALASLPDDVRRDLHRRAANAAEDASVAARHWLAAGDTEPAYERALAAADAAETVTARADLLLLSWQAADPERRAAMARRVGNAVLRAGGSYELVIAIAESVPEPRPVATQIELLCLRARRALDRSGVAEAELLLRDALASCDDETAPEEYYVRVLLGVAATTRFDFAGADQHLDRAIDIAAKNGRSSLRAETIRLVSHALLGDPAAYTSLVPVIENAAADEEPQIAFDAGLQAAVLASLQLRKEVAEDLLDRLAALARTLNHGEWAQQVRAVRCANHALEHPGDATAGAELQALHAEPATASSGAFVAAVQAIVTAWSGDVEAAEATVLAALDRVGEQLAGGVLDWAAAEIGWLAGSEQSTPTPVPELMPSTVLSAPCCAVLLRWSTFAGGGDVGRAPWPLAIAPALDGLPSEARALELLASPGHELDAADAFEVAAAQHVSYLGHAALRCRWAAADATRRAGDTAGAVERLTVLREDCVERGQLGLLRRIDESLRRSGVRPTGGRAEGVLTARQREVLSHLAKGASTADVAKQLAITERTVQAHLELSIERLGARNRNDAVRRFLLVEAGE